MTTTASSPDSIKAAVRDHYGRAVLSVLEGNRTSCCGGGSATSCNPISDDLYSPEERAQVPANAVIASFGCGNPTALAELSPGEVVLDLGSGGGIDVLLSARRVAPTGMAYGLDMTDEMLAAARENQRIAGVANAEFLHGDIEHIPLPDNSVDVIISNCVINLSGDKARVLREVFRVLRPGGRLAVSDIVIRGELPESARRSLELWAGCVAGALDEQRFLAMLREAGFVDASIEPTRIYTKADALAILESAGLDAAAIADAIGDRVLSGFVRARKPEHQ
jgi:SAM-dependent methyltransferase